MAPLRILINGAGVAGTCLALLLSRQGHKVTVLERHPELRVSGLQIDLRGPGIDILRRLGLEEQFLAVAAREEGYEIVDGKGRRWAYFSANNDREPVQGKGEAGTGREKKKKALQGFTTDYEIMRGDLCRLLHDAVEAEGTGSVEWRFGGEVTSIAETRRDVHGKKGKSVTVTIHQHVDKTSTEETYDLVVGADGVGSKIRRLMTTGPEQGPRRKVALEDDKSFLPYDGDYAGYFTMPRPKHAQNRSPAAIATMYMSPGKMVMTRGNPELHDHEQVYLICSIRGDNNNSSGSNKNTPNNGSSPLKIAHQQRDVAAQKTALAEMFADCGYTARLPEILRGLRDSDDFYLERLGVVKCATWSSVLSDPAESGSDSSDTSRRMGRVVLIGDAGYCPSSKTGMGTTSAMVGAWILAGELGAARTTSAAASAAGAQRDDDDLIDGAIRAYEAKLRPYVDQVQRGLPETSGLLDRCLETRVGIAVVYWVMALVSLLKVDIISRFVIREDIKDWELPVYD